MIGYSDLLFLKTWFSIIFILSVQYLWWMIPDTHAVGGRLDDKAR
jgi:hypothetical protein